MEMKIISEVENPVFKRKELEIEVESEVTPRRLEIAQAIAKKFSKKIEEIKIKASRAKFGSRLFEISLNIYDSEQDKNAVEKLKKKDSVLAEKKQRSSEDKPNPIGKEGANKESEGDGEQNAAKEKEEQSEEENKESGDK